MYRESIRRKMTDVELCIELEPAAVDEYRRALHVLTAYPDYAKQNFRKVVECLMQKIGKLYGINVKNFSLFDSIKELSKCQIIDHKLCTKLHKIRLIGNSAVHARICGSKDNVSKAEGAGNLESALSARETLVEIFKSVFLLLNKGEELPEIIVEEVGNEITNRQHLWEAVSSANFEAKMAGGLILESQALELLPKGKFIIEKSLYTHMQTNINMAAELYWSACVISAEDGLKSSFEINKMDKEEAFVFEYANTEALFRYSQLTFDQSKSEERQKRGVKALEAAAKRGYTDAQTEYGDWLREEGRFNESFKFISHALEKGNILAHARLGLLYLEKNYSDYSPKLAEQSFTNGININDKHCEYLLGRYLYEGKELVEDKERGQALLKKAMEAGYEPAEIYLKILIAKEELPLMFRTIASELQNIASFIKSLKGPKQGRNELCACQSGKKYKKCCGKE